MKPTIKNLKNLKKVQFHLFYINADGTRGLHLMGADFLRIFQDITHFLARQKPGERCFILTEESARKLKTDGIYTIPDGSQRDPSFGDKIQPYALTDLEKYLSSISL
jgi:hypothetical protein